MSKNGRNGGRRSSVDKASSEATTKHSVAIKSLIAYLNDAYVRCAMKDGSVYCGYIKSLDEKLKSLILSSPYIERSLRYHEQLKEGETLTIEIDNIYKVCTTRIVAEVSQDNKTNLSMGILDSLCLSTSIDDETPSFDDTERRHKAQSNLKRRQLESNFDFLTTSGDKVTLEEESFQMGSYDQFAENHSKFGVKSDFDITVYSTCVNSSEVPFELRQEAARMEQDMKSVVVTTNSHLLEERGVNVNLTEEDRYSTVRTGDRQSKDRADRRGNRRIRDDKEITRAIMRRVPSSPSTATVTPPDHVVQVATHANTMAEHVVAPRMELRPVPSQARSNVSPSQQRVITGTGKREEVKLVPKVELKRKEVKEEVKEVKEEMKEKKLSATAPEFVFKPKMNPSISTYPNQFTSGQMVPIMVAPMYGGPFMSGQMMPQGQMMPGQMMPGQMPQGQMMPGQMMPGQMPQGQMIPQGQQMPGQMMPPQGQQMPGQMMPPQGQQMPQGQPNQQPMVGMPGVGFGYNPMPFGMMRSGMMPYQGVPNQQYYMMNNQMQPGYNSTHNQSQPVVNGGN